MAEFTDYSGMERRRLNQRLHTITGTDVSRSFSRYRKEICRPQAVDSRNAHWVNVEYDGRRFQEPSDALTLMHRWLDENGVRRLAA